jgi:hypothetical protein
MLIMGPSDEIVTSKTANGDLEDSISQLLMEKSMDGVLLPAIALLIQEVLNFSASSNRRQWFKSTCRKARHPIILHDFDTFTITDTLL